MSGYELKGRHVLVTGASSGIGKELSRCFAKEGAHWILSSHPSEKKTCWIYPVNWKEIME